MLLDQGWAQLGQFFSELKSNLGTDKIFYGLFRRGFRVDLDFKLWSLAKLSVPNPTPLTQRQTRDRRHTTYSSSSVSCATSGILIEPETCSPSLVLPVNGLSRVFGVTTKKRIKKKTQDRSQPTFILKLHFNVEQCDDLALSLVDIHIAVHGQ